MELKEEVLENVSGGIRKTSQISNVHYTEYQVVAGDTLERLANYFGCTVDAIMANNPQITRPNLIKIGWKLVIPATKNYR